MSNRHSALFAVFIGLLVACTLWGYQQGKARPIKEGVVWKVIWSEGHGQTGLFREEMPKHPQLGQGGEYGVDLYGVLYPTCLEIRRPNRSNSLVQIIPFSQITSLEFGSGGVTLDK